MLETKFTKDNWNIHYPTNSNAIHIRKENDNSIAYVIAQDLYNKDIEQMANAKLISAAPDMFNALEELLAQVKQFTQGNIGEQDYFRDEISNAKKALNKAVGSDSF